MSKPVKFNVYPGKEMKDSKVSDWGWYFTVLIYPDQGSFHAALKERGRRIGIGVDEDLEFTRGLTNCYQRVLVGANGDEEVHRNIGLIYLYQECLGSETVSHESTHAAIGWARAEGMNPAEIFQVGEFDSVTDANERFCYAQGQITRQIVDKCYAMNLHKE